MAGAHTEELEWVGYARSDGGHLSLNQEAPPDHPVQQGGEGPASVSFAALEGTI